VLPEQAVWQHNRGRTTDDQAVALYPSDGTITMNYPYSLVTKDPDKLRGAELLRVAMNTPRARAAVHRLGFRTADDGVGQGFGPNTGLSPEVPYGLPTPSGKDVDLVIQTWGKLTLSTQGFRPLQTARPAIDPTP
jgi:hypothetical protein